MFHRLLFASFLLYTAHAQDWELFWQDEFDGTEINLDNWQHECTAWGGGNSEFEVYTSAPENSYVADGILYIKPTLLETNVNPTTGDVFGQDFLYNGELDLSAIYGCCTDAEPDTNCIRSGNGDGEWTDIPPIASARLRTNTKFDFRYGRVEINAKISAGDWMWPALWTLPEQWCYGGWPLSGEMDITESIGNEDLRRDGEPLGLQKMASTMHWGVDPGQNRYYLTTGDVINEDNDYGRNFHVYALEWTPNGFTYFVDGELVLQIPDPPIQNNTEWQGFFEFGQPWNDPNYNPWETNNDALMAPFDSPFHFIFNVAVGGTNGFIPDDAINRGGEYPKPWDNGVSQQQGMNEFYEARDQWLWTWEKEDEGGLQNSAMQVDYIRVYKRSDLPDEVECPAKSSP